MALSDRDYPIGKSARHDPRMIGCKLGLPCEVDRIREGQVLTLVPVNNIDLDLVMINVTPPYPNLQHHDP